MATEPTLRSARITFVARGDDAKDDDTTVSVTVSTRLGDSPEIQLAGLFNFARNEEWEDGPGRRYYAYDLNIDGSVGLSQVGEVTVRISINPEEDDDTDDDDDTVKFGFWLELAFDGNAPVRLKLDRSSSAFVLSKRNRTLTVSGWMVESG